MRNPECSLRRLNYALQFGIRIDQDAVEREIEKQTAITGGKSLDSVMARFSLAFTQGSPKAVTGYRA